MTLHSPLPELKSTEQITFTIRGIDPKWIVLALAAVVYGWNFWGTSIYMLDEAKNAGSAAEMIRRNDYLIPTFNGEFHDKPALQYFFMIVGYKLFGVGPFGARVFSVVMGILTVMSIYWFTQKILNRKTAFFASIIYISSLQMAVQFRLAVPDPYLLFCLTTAWFCFYLGYAKHNKRMLFFFYGLTGLGFLAKGPIAFALIGVSVLIFLLSQRDLSVRRLKRLEIVPGGLLALAVSMPWYLGAGLATDWDWPRYFFFTHNLDRYVNTFEGHGGFPFDVVVIAFAALLPLSVFMPQAVTLAIKERKENRFFGFALSICVAVLGFFFFSKTLLPSYPAPCIAFIAILLGYYIQQKSTVDFWVKASAMAAVLICIALPIAAHLALKQDVNLVSLAAHWWVFLPASIGAIAALYFIFKNNIDNAVYAWTGSFMVLLLVVFTFLFPRVDAQNPVAKSKDIISSSKGALAYYRRVNSSFIYYNKMPIQKLETPEQVAEFVRDNKEFMIISTSQDWQEINQAGLKIVFKSKDLFESPESIIITNQ